MDVSTISNNGFLGDTLLVKIAAWLWKVTEIFPSNVSLPNYLLFGKVREGGGGVHIDNNWVRKAIYLFFWVLKNESKHRKSVWKNWLMKWCRNIFYLKKLNVETYFFARSWLRLNDLCESFLTLVFILACFINDFSDEL